MSMCVVAQLFYRSVMMVIFMTFINLKNHTGYAIKNVSLLTKNTGT